MATKIFTIDNPANPIRLVNIKPKNQGKYFYQGFDDNLSDELIPDFQEKRCYYQKYTTQDIVKLQVLSDYTNIFCKLYDIYTGLEVATFTFNEITVSILNQTFKCYEVEIDFSIINEGEYQLVVSYLNDTPELIYYYSEPISVKEIQENTILIEYTNSFNDFSLLFDNNFKGILRVEAAIINFKPGSDDVIYNDQEKNSTTIHSVPFRQFQFFLGDSEGLPDWVIDKVNRAFSFDILSLDGVYYNKLEGAKFEEKRTTLYPFSGQVIDILPSENRFQEKINTDALIPIDDNMIQYQKVLKYLQNGADILIENKFKNGTILEKICIINRDIDFDLRVFTTSVGAADDIDTTFSVNGITATILINQLFSDVKTLNLTGLNGIDCDVYVLYKDLLATPSGTPNAYYSLGKGAVVIYEEQTPGDYDIDFNFSTGLGRPNTQWEGWAICDGRNGTQDRGGIFPIGYKQGGDFENLVSNTGGSDSITLSVENLPKFKAKLFANVAASGPVPTVTDTQQAAVSLTGNGSLDMRIAGTSTPATLGNTSEVGGDIPKPFLPKYIVSLFVKKIVN